MKKKIFAIIILLFGSLFLASCNHEKINGQIKSTATAVVIEVENDQRSLFVGDTLELSYKVYPETVPQFVIWESNNKEVASINQNGLVTGISNGRVKISAKADDTSAYLYLTVYKKAKKVTDILIIGSSEVYVDDYLKLDYQLTPSDADDQVVWTSEDEEIAYVDYNGRVYGLKPGVVKIFGTAGSITKDISIEVLARSGNPESISLKGRDWLEVASTMKLKVETFPLGRLNSVSFTSSDEEVLEVNQEGIVKGISAGVAEITAISTIDGSLKAKFVIEVLDYNINLDTWYQVKEEVIKNTKNSILGVANYRYSIVNGNYQLNKNSIGSGVVYKSWFTLEDGSIIYNIDDLESFNEVKTYHYYLVTNKHVLEGSDEVQIYLHEIDEEIPATLIQYDLKVDIAVVYFEYDQYIRPLKFGNLSNLNAGQEVIAIGNPSGFEFSSSATHGIISHPQRYLSDDTDGDGIFDWDAEYIQHDAAINPGNSGGPLLNLQGEIIGINTLKFAADDIDNMGFSIPSSTIVPLLEILEKGEIPKRATLGVTSFDIRSLLENPDPSYSVPEGVSYGIYVTALVPGKAMDAGVKIGDIILSGNGEKLRNTLDIRLVLAEIIVGNGDELVLEVLRDGQILEFILIY